jgi:hypothetical protein
MTIRAIIGTVAVLAGFAVIERSVDPATPHSYGWVPADTLSVDTRIDGTITTYSRPGLMGSVTGKVESGDVHFRVLGCRGELLQVINASQGNIWIDRWCARAEGCRG